MKAIIITILAIIILGFMLTILWHIYAKVRGQKWTWINYPAVSLTLIILAALYYIFSPIIQWIENIIRLLA